MATNHTAYYGLCQWEPEDNFIRTEFNADNLKVDTELKRVDAMAQESFRALPWVSYSVYNLLLQNYYAGKIVGYRKVMVFDGFLNGGYIVSSTGGAVVLDNVLTLNGVGAVGSVTSPSFGVADHWERAICWIRHNGGTVVPLLNGVEMPWSDTGSGTTMQGVSCIERKFTLVAPGERSAVVTLRLECGTSESMEVYDYGMILL